MSMCIVNLVAKLEHVRRVIREAPLVALRLPFLCMTACSTPSPVRRSTFDPAVSNPVPSRANGTSIRTSARHEPSGDNSASRG